MNTFAIDEARKPRRIGSIAIIVSGTVFGILAAAQPAFSADLPYEYRPHYSDYYRPSYDKACYRCSCCGTRPYAVERPIIEPVPFPVVEPRPVIERFPVAERHWVQRDYIERRYPVPPPRPGYFYPSYRYSYYYPGPAAADDPYYRSSELRPRYKGFEYPPAPVAYEYDAPRPPSRYAESPRPHEFRPAYEYEPSPRTAYDYEMFPRPPATIPSSYYHQPGYNE